MLYVCATPIGNMEDITIRVLHTLKEVQLIAAEDTRRTHKLLLHYQINTKLVSLHQHNEESKTSLLIEWLREGMDIALVSDAGMPGISDPGAILIKRMIDEDLPLTVLPGANAGLTALVQSGLLLGPYYFHGFLPRKKKHLLETLTALEPLSVPLIFYEAPHRLKQTLEQLYEVLGDRLCAVSRELTKKFEETRRGSISDMITHFENTAPRGEFVLVIQGKEETEEIEVNINITEHVGQLIRQGLSKKEAIKETAKLLGVQKNEVYQQVLDLEIPNEDTEP